MVSFLLFYIFIGVLRDIIKKILREGSIPIYKVQNPYKKIYQNLRKGFPQTPEYVLRDFFDNHIHEEKTIKTLIRDYYSDPVPFIRGYWKWYLEGPWKLQVLNLNPNDFNDKSIDAFIERDFGNINSYMVPNDFERMEIQRGLMKGDGTNEPVILVKNKDGKYELIEGWHRTMSLLKLGDNGEDLINWDPVKIRAFVHN